MCARQPRLITSLLLWMLAALPQAWCESWTLQDGTQTSGEFVRLSEMHLVILQNGMETTIPVRLLSTQSLDLAKARASNRRKDSVGDFGWDFILVPKGRFEMGVHKKHLQGNQKNLRFVLEDEPYRSASVTRAFQIKATEVTWSEWNKVRALREKFGYTEIAEGRNGYRGDEEGSHPVTEVSWWDAVTWCNLLSEVENRKPCYYAAAPFTRENVLRNAKADKLEIDWQANGYRLPTEAEWEYAWQTVGRAGGFEEPDGWHLENSEENTHPVRSRPSATAKKLHDMLGNVAEWCWDWKGPVVESSYEADPKGPDSGPHRIFRGGSWADHPMCCRGGYRGDFSPATPRSVFIGFRPLRPSLEPEKP